MTSIGWIGTGVMGKQMCLHLMKKGYKLNIFNRTQSKTLELQAQGAQFMSIQELASKSDAVILMLGYPKDVEEIVLGENGILNYMQQNTLLIDHTTSSPNVAMEIFKQAQKKQIDSLDAPVSGGDIGAKEGKLAIMCGGTEKSFQESLEIMNCYGANIQLMGDAGKGQHAKMVNQIVIANNMMGVVEGLIYGYKMGLQLDQVINLITKGAANSFSLGILGPRMLERNFEPGFYVQHFCKDMEIALEEARRANLCLPGLSQVKLFYQMLKAYGGDKMGTQALLLVLEKMNNLEINRYDPK